MPRKKKVDESTLFSNEFFNVDDLLQAKPLSKLAFYYTQHPPNGESSSTNIVTNPDYNTKYWTPKEKKGLLFGLKKYGFYKPEKIQEIIKTRTIMEVKQYIIRHRRKVALKMEKTKPSQCSTALNNWNRVMKSRINIRATNDDLSLMLPKMVEKMSQEEFPEEDKDGVPNFKEIYKHLALMLQGKMPTSVSRTDASLLKELQLCLQTFQDQHLSQQEKQIIEKRLKENLQTCKLNPSACEKVLLTLQKEERTEEENRLFDATSDIKGTIPIKLCYLNPLNIPVHLLQKEIEPNDL